MIKELATKANEIKAREPQFYCKDWLPIPKNTLTMISAPGGTGKSFLSIQLAIRIIAENPEHKILLWLSEDPLYYTKDRINKIFERIMPHLLDRKEEILKNIEIIDSDGEIVHFNKLSKEELKEAGDELVSYNVVILDPLIAFYAGEENSNSEARAFMNILNRIAKRRLLSIILIHHHNKGENGGRTRGASAFVDAVRLLYTLNTIKIGEEKKEIHPTKRLIRIEKDNWGVRQLLDTSEFEREILPYKVREVNIKDEKSNDEGEVEEKKPISELLF